MNKKFFLILCSVLITIMLIKTIDIIVGKLFNKNYYNYYYQKDKFYKNNQYIKLKEFKPNLDTWTRPFDISRKNKLLNEKYKILTDKYGFIEGGSVTNIDNRADKINLIFMGGSTTENIFVEQNNRFPYKTGQILKINSKNSGISGTNSLDSLNLLINKIVFLKPEKIVLMHNMNDLSSLIYSETTSYNNVVQSRKTLVNLSEEEILNEFSIFDIFKYIKNIFVPNIFEIYSKTGAYINFRKPKKEFDEIKIVPKISDEKINQIRTAITNNLLTFNMICQQHQIDLFLMTQPYNPEYTIDDTKLVDPNIIAKLQSQTNELIVQLANTNKIKIIDLDGFFKKKNNKSKYFYDQVHLNDEGNIIAGKFIAAQIQKFNINF